MLNISAKPSDNVLLYGQDGKLIGTVTCRAVGGDVTNAAPRVDLEFRMPPGVVVLREALVRRETDNIAECPPSLLARFSVAAPAA